MLGGSARPAAPQAPVRIAAAADLTFALEDVTARFERETHEHVDVVLGSSGTLTRQLLDGAPFELFLSADESFVDMLAAAGLTRDRGVLYAVGRLVIFAPTGSPMAVDARLEGLQTLLRHGGVKRFAIANPEFAPYGRAAQAALQARGLWDRIRPSLVLGDNIAQAATFAASGDAVGGLLAHSLVLAPPMQGRGTFAVVDDSLHPPIRQRMVLMKRASATAERFYAYLQSPPVRVTLEQYGFSLPHGR
jgi:molybdate transport system substrate-binding protein